MDRLIIQAKTKQKTCQVMLLSHSAVPVMTIFQIFQTVCAHNFPQQFCCIVLQQYSNTALKMTTVMTFCKGHISIISPSRISQQLFFPMEKKGKLQNSCWFLYDSFSQEFYNRSYDC